MLNKMIKSVIDQDRASVVICDLEHTIVYMNPAAKKNYEKWGGDLVGRNLMACHNPQSRESVEKLIGYYEKHEYRNPETAAFYVFSKSL